MINLIVDGPGFQMDVLCLVMPGGGGIYIRKGGLRQSAGSIKLDGCKSEGIGGGLLIKAGGFNQDATADIHCVDCSAKHGGCLATEQADLALDVHGTIEAHNCVAEGSGRFAFTSNTDNAPGQQWSLVLGTAS